MGVAVSPSIGRQYSREPAPLVAANTKVLPSDESATLANMSFDNTVPGGSGMTDRMTVRGATAGVGDHIASPPAAAPTISPKAHVTELRHKLCWPRPRLPRAGAPNSITSRDVEGV